ncbi:MAG: hypothetical protein IVW56_01960 [Candidatus Binataceae bacterium]|nr:hypothetical protein [Candidatus Binataceae bacterium]
MDIDEFTKNHPYTRWAARALIDRRAPAKINDVGSIHLIVPRRRAAGGSGSIVLRVNP